MKQCKRPSTLAAALISILLVWSVWLLMNRTEPAAVIGCRNIGQTLVIDPGHGGEDGGAVALSGTPESGINLSIALKAEQLCGLYGVRTVLTRREDASLADASVDTLREKKRSDLLNRTQLVNKTEGAVLLSVHQNNYANHSSQGAQVFFRNDAVSEAWAVQTQSLLRASLEPENQRAAAMIPENIYLMNHVNCAALLVECGFLSNPDDNKRLETDAYQCQVAAVLVASYLQFYNQKDVQS